MSREERKRSLQSSAFLSLSLVLSLVFLFACVSLFRFSCCFFRRSFRDSCSEESLTAFGAREAKHKDARREDKKKTKKKEYERRKL